MTPVIQSALDAPTYKKSGNHIQITVNLIKASAQHDFNVSSV